MTMKLSKFFSSSKVIQKYIEEDYILGWVVVNGGRGGGPKVWPIFRGDVHVKTKTSRGKPITHIFSTYEQGQPLNGQHYEDPEGAALAGIAATAIATLEERSRCRKYAAEGAKKRKKKA